MGDGYDCEKERIRADMLLTTAADCCLHRRRPGKPSKFPLTATKKWLFDLKNRGSFVLQQTRKVGHWQVARLRIYCSTRQAKTTLISTFRFVSFRLGPRKRASYDTRKHKEGTK